MAYFDVRVVHRHWYDLHTAALQVLWHVVRRLVSLFSRFYAKDSDASAGLGDLKGLRRLEDV